MKPFRTGFFHLAICIKGPSMSFRGLKAHLFLSLNNRAFCGHATVCLSIHLLKDTLDTWLLLSFGIVSKAAINICMQDISFLVCFGHKFATYLGKHLGVQLMDHTVRLCLFVRNCQTVFQSDCAILHSHQQHMRVPVAPHPHQHCVVSVLDFDHPNSIIVSH